MDYRLRPDVLRDYPDDDVDAEEVTQPIPLWLMLTLAALTAFVLVNLDILLR
jgi:hypothetical protein